MTVDDSMTYTKIAVSQEHSRYCVGDKTHCARHTETLQAMYHPTLKAVATLISGGQLPSAAVMSSCLCLSLSAAAV